MKFKLLNFSFLILLMTNMLTFMSNSWFFLWMIMEINLISFIKILSSNKNFNNELLMNYFLIQSFNSYLFIMSSIFMEMNFLIKIMHTMIILSMIFKMGLTPFFMWYLKMMMKLNCWITFFINSCMQKFIPLMIINNFSYINNYSNNSMFLFLTLINSLFISIIGINSTNLKLIMTISSMIQSYWIMSIILINENWLMYFIIYCLINLTIMMIFKLYSINHMLDMYLLKFDNKLIYFFLFMNMLSLSGLPPFLGFLNKFIYMWMMMKLNLLFMTILLMSSLMNLYFYMKFTFSILLNNFSSLNYMFKFLNKKNNKNLTLISLWMLSNLSMMLSEML